MLGLEGDRHWPDVVRAVERPEWLSDPRFETLEARIVNARELTGLLQEIFMAKPRGHWVQVFDRENVWWSPIQATHETIEDPQAIAAGGIVDVPVGDGTTTRMVASPVDFEGTPWQPRDMVPELGQHTEVVLAELGYDWDEIDRLKEAGVIN